METNEKPRRFPDASGATLTQAVGPNTVWQQYSTPTGRNCKGRLDDRPRL